MIQTSRLSLIDCDLDIWEAVLQGNNFLSQVLGVNVPKNWTENTDAFPMFVEMVKQNPDLVAWGGKLTIYKPDNLLIGTCGYKGKPSPEGMVEIGYEIKATHRGKGLATEAARALVDFAFNDPAVTLIIAHTLPNGSASTSVLSKLGFNCVGTDDDPDEGEVWRWELYR